MMRSFVQEVESSVDRLHHRWNSAVAHVALASQRQEGSKFFGWIAVTRQAAVQYGYCINLTRRTDNNFHADVVLPTALALTKEQWEEHAADMAREAIWWPAPWVTAAFLAS